MIKKMKRRIKIVLLMTLFMVFVGFCGIPLGIYWIITGKDIVDEVWGKVWNEIKPEEIK
jgi:NhaP-type Na+/H+ or K+/H+ antiporter